MAHEKRQYETLPGGERDMAAVTKPVVEQPTQLNETESYVLNLNPSDVASKIYFCFCLALNFNDLEAAVL